MLFMAADLNRAEHCLHTLVMRWRMSVVWMQGTCM